MKLKVEVLKLFIEYLKKKNYETHLMIAEERTFKLVIP